MTGILNLSKATAVLDLTKAAPTLKRFRGILNWNVHPLAKASLTEGFDLDVFALVLNSAHKITGGGDVVFFNNKSAHGVTYPRDNRTGEGDDDEELIVDFAKVPADKHHIDVYVFINEAEKRKQNFGMIQGGVFQVTDADSNAVIQTYRLDQFKNETALMVGSLHRTGSGWSFEPVGSVSITDPNKVAGFYL